MSINYGSYYASRAKLSASTPISSPIPGREKDMTPNSAGGFAFKANDWDKLNRFLILGTEGGSFYATEQKLTIENAKIVSQLIDEDGIRVVNTVVEVSDQGKAKSNDQALFVLAMAASADSLEVRKAALEALPKVARIGTHLFHFADYVQQFRGWGRTLRKAIANWYLNRPVDSLVLNAIKYQSRDGFSHRDMIRLAHPETADPVRNSIFRWMTGGMDALESTERKVRDNTSTKELRSVYRPNLSEYLPTQILAVEALKSANINDAVNIIKSHRIPRECVPTEMLNEISVWEALNDDMAVGATIRNLGKMTSIGLLKPMSNDSKIVVDRLTNIDGLKRQRVHPLTILNALMVYKNRRGDKGSLTWSPVREIIDALDTAFYLSFGAVEPTNKNLMLSLDVSGSMSWYKIAGTPMTPREASAALALITANVERNYLITGFSHTLVDIDISPKMRLDDVIRKISNVSMGATDISLPMVSAIERKIDVDAFCIYTDSECNVNSRYGHPTQALNRYRQVSGRNAKLITVGMVSNGFTVSDPNDPGQLDVVGFSTDTPSAISEFVKI